MNRTNKKRRSHQSSRPYNSVPAFLLKTYEIIDTPTYNNLICWNKEGNAFIVKNANGFAEEVLPKYFKHNNFASFIRQLNMYDFHKTRHEENEDEFRHKFFKRGQKHLLSEIKRKTPDAQNETAHQLAQAEKNSEMHRIKREAQYFSKELANLKGRQSELDKTVKTMYTQNTKLTDENKLIWGQLVKNKDKYEKRIEKLMMFIASMMHNGGNVLEGGPMRKSLPFSENALEKNDIAKMENFEQFRKSLEGSNILDEALSDKETENSLQNSLEMLKKDSEDKTPTGQDIVIKTGNPRGYNLRSQRREPFPVAPREEDTYKKTNKRLYPLKKSTRQAEPEEMPTKHVKTDDGQTKMPLSAVSTTSQVINFDKEVEPKLPPVSVGMMENDSSAFGATSANQNRFMMPVDNDPFSMSLKTFHNANDDYDMSMPSVYPDNFKNSFKMEDKDEPMLEDPGYIQSSFLNNSMNLNLNDDWPLTFKRTTSDRFK